MMTGKAADAPMTRAFGCLCYYLPPQGSFGKFEQRGRAGIFLGLSNARKAWIVRDLASDMETDTRSTRFFDDLMMPDAESVLERQRYMEEISPHIDGWTSGGEGFGSEFDSFPASPPSPTSSTDISTSQGHEAEITNSTKEDPPTVDATNTEEGAATNDLPAAGVSISEGAEDNEIDEACHLYDFAYPPDGVPLAAHDPTPRRVLFNPTNTVLGGERQGVDTMTRVDVLLGNRHAGQAKRIDPGSLQVVTSLSDLQQHVLGCAASGIPMVDLRRTRSIRSSGQSGHTKGNNGADGRSRSKGETR
ncbi:unnamed protein product [Closterium sp. NIES-54]